MSSGKTGGNKWVSTRVLQQKQQQTPATAPATSNVAAGSKIMEDKAIAAARIKENQSSPAPETEVPESKFFEVQEATDALSNLAHNAEPTVYELFGEPIIKQHQTAEAFHALIMEQVQQTRAANEVLERVGSLMAHVRHRAHAPNPPSSSVCARHDVQVLTWMCVGAGGVGGLCSGGFAHGCARGMGATTCMLCPTTERVANAHDLAKDIWTMHNSCSHTHAQSCQCFSFKLCVLRKK